MKPASIQSLTAGALGVVLLSAPVAAVEPFYQETYRPAYHYSPPHNWTNEPHGMFYIDGQYHLTFQHNPTENVFGNQHWGHAVSPDLLHWETLPNALSPEPSPQGTVFPFTGSVVVDHDNTSGLGTAQNPPVVAVYTGFTPDNNGRQDQRIAVSLDRGQTFMPFAGNPVLDIGSNEFRDPRVIWHEPTQRWTMVTAQGGQNQLLFHTSPDLQQWFITGIFTAPDLPGSISGWEVPDLMQLPVDGDTNNTKWVLMHTPAQGSPAGGNGVLYFVGEFDGNNFTSENPVGTPLWVDHGRDFDGTQTWQDDPDGRVIMTGIMQSYGNSVPTDPWRGQFALPRELSLVTTPDGLRLKQTPIDEVESLRTNPVSIQNMAVTPTSDPLVGSGIAGDALELVATFDPGTADFFGFNVREGNGQLTQIGYDAAGGEVFVNRTQSGEFAFNPNVATGNDAPLALDGNGHVKLRIFVDRNSVEVFGGEGTAALTNLIFPDPDSQGVSAFSIGGDATLVSLEAYNLNGTFSTATRTVAHWSMDDAGNGPSPGNNPATLDSATLIGQGLSLGGNANLDAAASAADDQLWTFNARQLVGGSQNEYVTSTDVAPASMFRGGGDAGTSSYDASAIDGVNGVLFMPADVYGEEVNFAGGFSVEMFFQTNGNQSAAGAMQLLKQGENDERYGLTVNEGGAGNVRFRLNDKAGQTAFVDITPGTGLNYAEGEWHYLLATYDPSVGANGGLALTLLNEDGTFDTASTMLGASFGVLPNNADGNLLIGRNTFAVGDDPRTFLGLIDEVRLTNGIVRPGDALGLITLTGDYNGDGFVSQGDLDLVLLNWGDTVVPAGFDEDAIPGGGPFDGLMSQNELDGVLLNWGNGTPPSANSIPEPTTAGLLAMLSVVLGSSRRSSTQ